MSNVLKIIYLYDGLNWMTLAHSGVMPSAIFGRRENHSYSRCDVYVQ